MRESEEIAQLAREAAAAADAIEAGLLGGLAVGAYRGFGFGVYGLGFRFLLGFGVEGLR